MYFGILPEKDTTITDAKIDGVSKTGSNSGLSEILELYSLTSSLSGRGKSRVLVKFDLTSLSSSTASEEIPSSSVEYRLKLKNARHYEKLPSSFVIEISQLSRSWDEGRGLSMHDEELKDAGYANWVNATSLQVWDSEGADFYTSRAVTQSFDFGDEDLDLDVSDIVGSWLTGGEPNHGFMVKLLDAHETGSVDVFVKKFFSRHAHVPERRPRLETLWEDIKQDDRETFKYKVTGSLFYYRFINGQPQNVGTVYVDVINSSSIVVQTITASNPETGIYHASGVFVESDGTTEIYTDLWFTDNEQLFTGSFTPQFATGSDHYGYDDLDVLLSNLKSEYSLGEKVFVRVLGKEKNYRPAIRKSGSAGVDILTFSDAYYAIDNAETEENIIPFSTGTLKYTKLSYDENGNYFQLRTDGLSKEALYKVKILVNYNNQKIIYDKDWTFKVLQG